MERREFLWRTAAAAAVGATGACRGSAATRPLAAGGQRFEETDVFVSGDGYPTYRIPSAIVTRRGTVLAFAEGRQAQGDHTQNDLVLRRSADGGRTWEPRQLVASDRPAVRARRLRAAHPRPVRPRVAHRGARPGLKR